MWLVALLFTSKYDNNYFVHQILSKVIVLEGNMKTPKNFGGLFGVLNIGMFFVVILYFGLGLMGYWKYGDEVNASVTLNFPPQEVYVF